MPVVYQHANSLAARLRRRLRVAAMYVGQAAGQSFAPLIGGFAAAVSWRWAFVAVALAAALLALAPPPGSARPGAAAPRIRPLLTVPMAQLSVSAFVSYFGAAALPFLVALYAEDRLALRPEITGFALLGFGVAGVLLGAAWGSVAARFDARWCAGLAAVVTAVLVACTGRTTSLVGLMLCWTAAGASNSMLNVGLQYLTVRAVPSNRGGALSAVSAFRFTGAALAPVALLPLYHTRMSTSFLVAAATLLVATVALIALPGRSSA